MTVKQMTDLLKSHALAWKRAHTDDDVRRWREIKRQIMAVLRSHDGPFRLNAVDEVRINADGDGYGYGYGDGVLQT